MAIEVVPKNVCDKKHDAVDRDSSGKVVYCPMSGRKILSIEFVDANGKPLPGIDKEDKVKLKIKFNDKYTGSDEVFINLDECTDFEFECDGKKITNTEYLKITADKTLVELSAKFKIQ